MLLFSYRHLANSVLRTALTATAIAAVVAVILVLEGFQRGLSHQSRQLVLDRQADLIVTQAGVTNMHAARSILPQFARQEIEEIPGVRAAHPLTGLLTIYERPERSSPIYVFVYDTAGGPRRLVKGGPAMTPRDIVIDRSLSVMYGLEPGDPFVLSGFEFRVAGITAGDAALLTPLGFIRFDGLLDFYFESDVAADISTFPLLSFLLVELGPGADRDTVARLIRGRVPDGEVFVPERLAENDASLVGVMFGTVFDLLISVAYVIGVLVTAIIMFAAVHGRRRSFGVLRALGFSPAFLSGTVMLEAIGLAMIAIPAGVVLAAGIAAAVEAWMPLYRVLALEPQAIARTALVCLVFTVLGALAPLGNIRRVDPAIAFRS